MIKIIKEKINKSEEGEEMLLESFVDTLYNCIKEGEKNGISQVAINMLKEKCDKKMIKKCTGLSDAKIKELEKTLQNA